MALDPTNPAARKMVETLLSEVAALEGGSEFVHVGGDEGRCGCPVSHECARANFHGKKALLYERAIPLSLLRTVRLLIRTHFFICFLSDTVKFPCWNSSSIIATHVKTTYGDLSAESFARLQAEWTANVSCAAVKSAGKRPVLWQPTTQGMYYSIYCRSTVCSMHAYMYTHLSTIACSMSLFCF